MERHKEYSSHIDSNIVVLFVHGIMGSPEMFRVYTEKLEGKYSYESLLLPGHGKTLREFAASSMEEWQKYVDDRVKVLEKKYKKIYIAGHSLGCLLAMKTASEHQHTVKGLFLISPPLKLRMTASYFINNMKVLRSPKRDNNMIATARKVTSVATASAVKYLGAIPRYRELLHKIKQSRELISYLHNDIYIIYPSNDEIVSFESVKMFYWDAGLYIARDSTHYCFPPQEQEIIAQKLVSFIR